MLYGGFGTLIFFGIPSRTAKNQITAEKFVTKTEKTYRTETYPDPSPSWSFGSSTIKTPPRMFTRTVEINSRPSAWENRYACSTQYYDTNGYLCGTSQSTGTGAELNTTYYDANRHVCGTSISREKSDDRWETDYYNSDRQHCGTSISRGKSTTYDLLDGRTWDTSESDSYGNTTYISTQQIAERKEQERVEKERTKAETDQKYTVRNAKGTGTHKIGSSDPSLPSSGELKRYYLSQASFFNKSSHVFRSGCNTWNIQELKKCAQKNPGGASDKTLRYFGL